MILTGMLLLATLTPSGFKCPATVTEVKEGAGVVWIEKDTDLVALIIKQDRCLHHYGVRAPCLATVTKTGAEALRIRCGEAYDKVEEADDPS